MNEIDTILSQVDHFQEEIESYGKLDAEIAKRIQYKFRLDWNYYSNAMEGNSLTRIETKQLMMDNVTIDGKPFKDIAEMRGHDTEVLEILKIGKGEVRISERRIREVHKAIMYEDDQEKRSLIGKWKTSDNHIINYRSEKFSFLPHQEVPEAMHRLLNETNAEIDTFYSGKKNRKHPVLIALRFHLRYLEIHPFYDGNGRTGRLLMNLLLISFGYPPIILREKDRVSYYKILAEVQGYGANPDGFYVFLGKLLLESQQLVLNVIEGKDVAEDDDLDKEILLWKSGLDGEVNDVKEKGDFLIAELYEKSFRSLFVSFIQKHKQFDDLFLNVDFENQINSRFRNVSELEYFEKWIDFKGREMQIMAKELSEHQRLSLIITEIRLDPDFKDFTDPITKMKLTIKFLGFKKSKSPFDVYSELTLQFDQYKYGVQVNGRIDQETEKLYTSIYTEKEIKKIVDDKVREFWSSLKIQVEAKL